MKNVRISLYSPDSFRTNDPVSVIFEISNTSKQTISVLKWFTPLEGLISPCLVVKSESKTIPYDGIKAKRAKPSAEDFIQLEPGQTISKKVDLEKAYNIPLSGLITIEFDDRRFFITKLNKIGVTTVYSQPTKARSIRGYSINNCAFRVSRNKKMIFTLGMLARAKMKKGKKSRAVGPKDPLFQNMTTAEKEIVKKAHVAGHSLTTAALITLANDAKYKKWFGVHSPGRFGVVKTVFTQVKTGMEKTQFTYIKDGPSCTPKIIAYTFDNSDKIFLCAAYWKLNQTGSDSQAGTMVHEHTHASATTEDYADDMAEAVALAKSDPDQAVDCANNFEYYAET